MTDLADRSIHELHALLRSGETSVEEALRANLARIDAHDEELRAFLAVDREGALAEARRLDAEIGQGRPLRPLHGVTVGIKDVIPARGLPFTLGSLPLADRVADEDAVLVARLREAGAIVLGKTNTPEFAAFMNTRNAIRGTTVSPWDTSLSSGGSSGGSAVAVAVGMCTAAIGTDHGGSVRFPAAMNGILGLRPTPGRVPVFPSPWVYDEFDVHGPLARSAEDLRALLAAMEGPDPRVPISGLRSYRPVEGASPRSLDGLRIAWTPDLDGAMRVMAEIRDVCAAAVAGLADAGAQVVERSPDVTATIAAIRPLRMMRALIEHAERLEDLEGLNNQLLRGNLEAALRASPRDLAAGQSHRSAAWLATRTFFDDVDVLALPTTQVLSFPKDAAFPPTIDDFVVTDALDTVLSTYVFSILGWPSLSVPAGTARDGMPVGLQLVGPPGSEDVLLGVAERLGRTGSWGYRTPPILAA